MAPSQYPSSTPSSLLPFLPPPSHHDLQHPSAIRQEQYLREKQQSASASPPILSPLPLPRRPNSYLRPVSSRSSLSMVTRTNSAHLPWEPLASEILNAAVTRDLEAYSFNASVKFLDHLLPPDRNPIQVDLFTELSKSVGSEPPIWDSKKMKFNVMPKVWKEPEVCEWLNTIGRAIGAACQLKPKRLWWSGTCNTPIGGALAQRKPDIILLDRDYHSKIVSSMLITDWAFVISFAEVTSQKLEPPRMRATVDDKTYLTFACQPHRRFAIALSFVSGNLKTGILKITVTDRAGQLLVSNIDLQGTRESALALLTVVSFLMFGTPADVGLDPHCEIHPLKGEVIAITCGDRRYQVIKQLYAMTTLLGRGTRVWIVEHANKQYVLKDSWPQDDCRQSEVDFLKKMQSHNDVKGSVPTLVWGGDVTIDGVKDSTRSYRGPDFEGPHPQRFQRDHRRLVTFPVGEPITSLKSKKEFINAMRGIITTHRYLCYQIGILHSDISVNNVLLNRSDDTPEASGLLIDFDYSDNIALGHATDNVNEQDVVETANTSSIEGDVDIGAGDVIVRTGTPPYMAIEALFLDKDFVHKPHHDLESILYIIIFICTFVQGPASLLHGRDIPPSKVCTWFGMEEMEEVGYRKGAHLDRPERAILPYFTKYWDDFIPFVKELITTCFPVKSSLPNELDHDKALEILERAYNTVQEPLDDRENQLLVGVKRERAASSYRSRSSKRGRNMGS